MGYRTYTCPHAAKCGGCEWLSVPYPIQLERKRQALDELFEPLGIRAERVCGMEEPLAYRHKVMSPFAPGKRNGRGERGKRPKMPRPQCGFYAKGTHDIVEVQKCLVEPRIGWDIINSILDIVQDFSILPYDEDTGSGLLRHVIVRIGKHTGQVMVTLVVNRKEFPRKKAFVQELRRRHPQISSVVFNVNTRKTNAVLGPLCMTAYGQGWIEDELCGCTFRIPADAFYQTNPAQTEVLYRTAIDMAQLKDGERVLDAYCGIGTIGIIAAKQTPIELVGVESVPSAIDVARDNARINRVRDATFVCADAGEYLARSEEAFDLVIMDPPRAGASEQFLRALLAAAPSRIVYISCNPTTQARDIRMLAGGYEPARIVGVDMFPHTKHIESVALLERAGGR